MKRLLASLLSLSLLAGSASGMQNDSNALINADAPISYEMNSHLDESRQIYSINATIPTQSQAIGFIRYYVDTQKEIGVISSFRVKPTFRKQHIGFNLFQQAVQDMIKRSTTTTAIRWVAQPDIGASLDILCDIYQKIVAKLGKGFELSIDWLPARAEMTLKIIKPNNNK